MLFTFTSSSFPIAELSGYFWFLDWLLHYPTSMWISLQNGEWGFKKQSNKAISQFH